MKYRIAAITVMLATLLAVHVQADPARWHCIFSTGSNYGGAGATFGTHPTTSDGYDPPSSDPYAPSDQAIHAGYNMYVATYHGSDTEENAWTGPAGFYWNDYRAPLAMSSGLSKTWKMYVWAALSSWNIYFTWYNYSPLPGEFHFTLTLKSKPAGIIGGPIAGTVWDLSAQPNAGIQLPIFRTANGLEGYVFDFTATVIPEPSSLAALLAGLGGFGAMIRRRG